MQSDPASVPDADFGRMVLDNLRSTGVSQKNKADTIRFSSVEPWPGKGWLAAEARYDDGGGREKRAGILIGPEFGTLTRSQITAAAREASENRFDVLIACAFNFDAQATDLNRLGPLAILKARMNPDLHMADDVRRQGRRAAAAGIPRRLSGSLDRSASQRRHRRFDRRRLRRPPSSTHSSSPHARMPDTRLHHGMSTADLLATEDPLDR